MGVPFLHIKHELCSLRAYTIIVCWYRELVDKLINLFLLQIRSQLQFNGHPSIIIAEIPDTFPQNSIDHRSNLTLSSSVTTRQSSNKFGFALAAPSLRPECARWNQSLSLYSITLRFLSLSGFPSFWDGSRYPNFAVAQ